MINIEKVLNKSAFVQGAISPELVTNTITKHQSKTVIGAHDIFLGQVRSDIIENKHVMGIEYSAHVTMAERVFEQIKSTACEKFDLMEIDIIHSLGFVRSGEICLFVMLSTGHRDELYAALSYVVEEIKANVPIFGKEMFTDNSYIWKVNR